jgi:hypothetical protein
MKSSLDVKSAAADLLSAMFGGPAIPAFFEVHSIRPAAQDKRQNSQIKHSGGYSQPVGGNQVATVTGLARRGPGVRFF